METISVTQLSQKLQQNPNVQLLDVRTPAEHAEVHAVGVKLLSLDQLSAATLLGDLGMTKDQPLYIFCRSGTRAKQAAQKLERDGFSACHVVEGGTMGWAEAGLPVVRGTSKVISLERQVRIAAGSLVLSGVFLGRFVWPEFIWLSAFVGCGLIFAGIADWCGMGLLLARMPWNQNRKSV